MDTKELIALINILEEDFINAEAYPGAGLPYEGEPEAEEKLRAEVQALRDRLVQADELETENKNLRLQLQYPNPEDMPGELAAKFCPFNDPLHFHHDGCPSEWAAEQRTRAPDPSVVAPLPAKVPEGLDPRTEEGR